MKTAADMYDWGRSLREQAPLESQAEVGDPSQRDPVGWITGQEASRLGFLLGLRHERMGASPFAFYRGSAVVQAADLATTPVAGIHVQLCGDAHLANFGLYGSPERRLVFDLNDFDETLPGPFEWDVKRLAASFVLAGRELGLEGRDGKKAAQWAARAYRETVAGLGRSRYIDAWYARVDVDELEQQIFKEEDDAQASASGSRKLLDKARSKNSLRALKRLAVEVDGRYRIKPQPPTIVPLREIEHGVDPDELRETIRRVVEHYERSLPDARVALVRRYRIVDFALKVVGVGSVGTRCYIALCEGRDKDDPLFLQFKEAGPSVLEAHLPRSRYPNAGQRVVEGQRLMQQASDVFLGWTEHAEDGHEYYVRQMWDMKGGADFTSFTPKQLRAYARCCGWTLAHAHSRTGSAAAISGYLGDDETFDHAIARYALDYADRAEADHAAFRSACP